MTHSLMAYLSLCEWVEFLHHYLFHNLQIKQQDVGTPAQIVPENNHIISVFMQCIKVPKEPNTALASFLGSSLAVHTLCSWKARRGDLGIIVHHFSLHRASGAGPEDPVTTGPKLWLRWCCQPFGCRRETRIIIYTHSYPYKLHNLSIKRTKNELQRAWLHC